MKWLTILLLIFGCTMGKATITSNDGDGLYRVEIDRGQELMQAMVDNIDEKIDYIEGLSEDEITGAQKIKIDQLKLRKRRLQALIDAQPTASAWCADHSLELDGDVDTIEINGEPEHYIIAPQSPGHHTLQPGYQYPIMAQSAAQAAFNFAVHPGWQKWKPTYRIGTITAVNGDSCDIDLNPVDSHYQGLGINQDESLSDVPIKYMTCNGAVFMEGDEVVVEFVDQDWKDPQVIGFKEEPRPCRFDITIYQDLAERNLFPSQVSGLSIRVIVDGDPIEVNDPDGFEWEEPVFLIYFDPEIFTGDAEDAYGHATKGDVREKIFIGECYIKASFEGDVESLTSCMGEEISDGVCESNYNPYEGRDKYFYSTAHAPGEFVWHVPYWEVDDTLSAGHDPDMGDATIVSVDPYDEDEGEELDIENYPGGFYSYHILDSDGYWVSTRYRFDEEGVTMYNKLAVKSSIPYEVYYGIVTSADSSYTIRTARTYDGSDYGKERVYISWDGDISGSLSISESLPDPLAEESRSFSPASEFRTHELRYTLGTISNFLCYEFSNGEVFEINISPYQY